MLIRSHFSTRTAYLWSRNLKPVRLFYSSQDDFRDLKCHARFWLPRAGASILLALVVACAELKTQPSITDVESTRPSTENEKAAAPLVPPFSVDSTCIGRPVTQKCAVDTYWSCIASHKPELCEAIGVKRDALPQPPAGRRLKGVSYLIDDVRWQGGVMGWDSGVYHVRKRWPIRETYCEELDAACTPSYVRYTFLSLAPDWRTGLWKVSAQTAGYPRALYPQPKTGHIHNLTSSSDCLGDMTRPLCAALTVLACREQGVCRDMTTGKLTLAPYSYRADRYLEYRVWDVYEDREQASAPQWNVVISFRSCPLSANPNDRRCVGGSNWSAHLFKMIRQADGIWAADRIMPTL